MDVLVSCPYDAGHRVKRSRLRIHILKCEKTHPPLAVCFYDGTHRVPRDQLASHMAECTSRRDVAAPPDRARLLPAARALPPPCPSSSAPIYNRTCPDTDTDIET